MLASQLLSRMKEDADLISASAPPEMLIFKHIAEDLRRTVNMLTNPKNYSDFEVKNSQGKK
jgi:hypothetical protein